MMCYNQLLVIKYVLATKFQKVEVKSTIHNEGMCTERVSRKAKDLNVICSIISVNITKKYQTAMLYSQQYYS